MNRRLRAFAALTLGVGLITLPQSRAADEKAAKAEKPKATDWSGYVTVSTIVAEVVSTTTSGVTLRVSWVAAGSANGNNGRPQLGRSNGRSMSNPFMRRSGQRPQVHVEHHDYSLSFATGGLVRTKALPPKTDDNGKAVAYKPAELAELKLPPGAPGYAAETGDLTAGTIAEFTLVRDRDVPAAKATEADLKIKYAIVLGRNPNPTAAGKKN